MTQPSQTSRGHLDPAAKEFHPYAFLHHQNPNNCFLPPPPLPPLSFFPTLLPLPPPPQLILPFPPQLQQPPTAYFQFGLPPPRPCSTPPPATTNAPSRSLLLTSVPRNVTELELWQGLSPFGEIRNMDMSRIFEGAIVIHFYDLRNSQNALKEIRTQQNRLRPLYEQSSLTSQVVPPPPCPAPGLISGCPIWADFVIPEAIEGVHDGQNHGTIVIFNLDANISSDTLINIFQDFGPVKEVRGTPLKKRQKFLEFYDVRDAAEAVRQMNGRVIHGKQITIDFSRPGGHVRRWSTYQSTSREQQQQQQQPELMLPHGKPTRKNNVCTSPNTVRKNDLFPAAVSRLDSCQARGPKKATTTSEGGDNNNNNSGRRRRNDGCSTGGTVEDSPVSSSGSVEEKNGAVLVKGVVRVVAGIKSCRPVKGRKKGLDTKFLIKEDEIKGGDDSRTTVMIKNIPNKYSQKLLLSMLDNHCAHCNEKILSGDDDQQPLSSYDFVYLPMDFNNKCNVGYGFVNMTSPEATMRLYKAFHGQSWEVFNSRKICQVTYARVQGLNSLKEHFRNSKFPNATDDILPVVFDPPRDGRRQMTLPQPVYGATRSNNNSRSCSRSNSTAESCGSHHDADETSSEGIEEEMVELQLRVSQDVTGVERLSSNGGRCGSGSDGDDVVVGTANSVEQVCNDDEQK